MRVEVKALEDLRRGDLVTMVDHVRMSCIGGYVDFAGGEPGVFAYGVFVPCKGRDWVGTREVADGQ